MTHRRKLFSVLTASAILSCIAALGAMYFATERYQKAVQDSQIERASYIVNQYVNTTVWRRFATNVGNLARDISQEDNIRKAVGATDRDWLKQLLPDVSRRSVVTSGEITIMGITVYRGDGTTIAEYVTTPALGSTAMLSDPLAKRQGNDRFQRMSHVWTDGGAPRLSVIVPVGGLKLLGYLAVHVDPLHALESLDNTLGMQIAFTSLDGANRLAELQNFKIPDGATVRQGAVAVKAPGGLPIFRAAIAWDDSETENLMRSVREWSFLITIAVLALIATATLILVLIVSRQMAREDSEAAKAALSARLVEEQAQRDAEQVKEADLKASAGRHAMMEQLATELDRSVKTVADNVSAAATQIEQNAAMLSGLAVRTTRQAETARTASADATASVHTVSSATEQMTGSIAKIGAKMLQASQVTSQAVENTKHIDVKVALLGTAVNKIGEVIALINSIAAQTNLLALNATIEAARAGDMGKGFAIVAQEVKLLAGQTAKATGEIATQINSVQVATTQVVEATHAISTTIEEINQISAAIAVEVQDQQAGAAEILKAVNQAADGATMISSSVVKVTNEAMETASKAEELRAASVNLTRQSVVLREKVDDFGRGIRTA
jgi:methyl-accepting chemotaxis protein